MRSDIIHSEPALLSTGAASGKEATPVWFSPAGGPKAFALATYILPDIRTKYLPRLVEKGVDKHTAYWYNIQRRMKRAAREGVDPEFPGNPQGFRYKTRRHFRNCGCPACFFRRRYVSS